MENKNFEVEDFDENDITELEKETDRLLKELGEVSNQIDNYFKNLDVMTAEFEDCKKLISESRKMLSAVNQNVVVLREKIKKINKISDGIN